VLGVNSKVEVMKITHRQPVHADAVTLSETPPSSPGAARDWAIAWATERARHKSARNYAEADRIRALLGTHGFQVRDSRDGSIEVVRTAGSKSNT
jgi:cysteinyl-tRNA synthetase